MQETENIITILACDSICWALYLAGKTKVIKHICPCLQSLWGSPLPSEWILNSLAWRIWFLSLSLLLPLFIPLPSILLKCPPDPSCLEIPPHLWTLRLSVTSAVSLLLVWSFTATSAFFFWLWHPVFVRSPFHPTTTTLDEVLMIGRAHRVGSWSRPRTPHSGYCSWFKDMVYNPSKASHSLWAFRVKIVQVGPPNGHEYTMSIFTAL